MDSRQLFPREKVLVNRPSLPRVSSPESDASSAVAPEVALEASNGDGDPTVVNGKKPNAMSCALGGNGFVRVSGLVTTGPAFEFGGPEVRALLLSGALALL